MLNKIKKFIIIKKIERLNKLSRYYDKNDQKNKALKMNNRALNLFNNHIRPF